MLIHTLFFLIFYWLIFFIGRGFIVLFSKLYLKNNFKDSNHFFGIPYIYFYSIIGLSLIGNIAFFLNFFIKVNHPFFYSLIFLLLLINITSPFKTSLNLSFLISFFFIPLIISTSSATINFSYDAGLYQLNNQYWIRESLISLGFNNLNIRYGYSSLIEYISSTIWGFGNFAILHYVNLSFITFFFGFITYTSLLSKNFILKNSSISLIIFGVLDNFGFGGGRNGFIDIESIVKQDSAFSIIFYISNILLFSALNFKKIKNREILLISFLILFSIQLRIFGLVSLLLLFYVIYNSDLINVKTFKLLVPSAVLGIFWGIKNLLITGCLLFPVEITCYDFSWYEKNSASLEMLSIKSFHIGYIVGEPLTDWLLSWLDKPINKNTIYNFIISIFLIKSFLFIFSEKGIKKNKLSINFNIFALIYLSTIYFVWIISAPGIRLGLGLFLLTLGVLCSSDSIKNYKLKNTLVVFFIFISSIFLPRLDNYKILLQNPFLYNNLSLPEFEYKEKVGYGVVRSDNNSQCWVRLDCVQNEKKIIIKNLFKYKLFTTKPDV